MTSSSELIPVQCKAATTLFLRVNEIIELIPQDYPKREEIIHSLKGRQNSIHYTHPDAMSIRWGEVAQILEHNLPDPQEVGWAKEVAELFGEPM